MNGFFYLANEALAIVPELCSWARIIAHRAALAFLHLPERDFCPFFFRRVYVLSVLSLGKASRSHFATLP